MAGLKKDVFVALAAIGWADGTLDAEEADAIVRAAVDEGLDLAEIADIETATREKIDLGVVDRSQMTKEDRLFVYAIACWIAGLDAKVTGAESEALGKLGERLGVPERLRAFAESVTREVAQLPEGDRPARYDLPKVRRLLEQRLEQAKQS
jgi:uncharacterized membrane protein YebE (DUF533 family)